MRLLLITPPFCQLNTPYPATAFLKAWFVRDGHDVRQADTGLETFLSIFSREGLEEVFSLPSDKTDPQEPDAIRRIRAMKDRYMETIEPVIGFLQGKDRGMASLLCRPGFLPEGDRFIRNSPDPDSFGPMGITDLARYRCTLYLEDLGDFITRAVDEDFGFSRYAERLALSPPSFDDLALRCEFRDSLVDRHHRRILHRHAAEFRPDLVGFSIPFPGNLLQALKGAQFLREEFPRIKICAGGGYVSTELRDLEDPRIMKFFHYITLDDGEDAMTPLIRQLEEKSRGGGFDPEELNRTYYVEGEDFFYSGEEDSRCTHKDRPAPDYSDLPLDRYISLTDRENPMHRLWSEGPWLKMMLAHGCYWHRCAFCDTSLDYIQRYDPAPAAVIAGQMEELIRRTGRRSFHFIDEAAPPRLLKDLALELISRRTGAVWWTNIRFERHFTPDLCRLLARSGCIAVLGGLEVASDRVLKGMDKGVTVEQTVAAARAFRDAGIMVHTYLMYGFPGQSETELMDALETVRQMFEAELIQSAYWHQFALTAHSPVGQDPAQYGVTVTGPEFAGFARNDLEFLQEGPDLSVYGQGLQTALYNYMHRRGFHLPLKTWFSFRPPSASVKRNQVKHLLDRTVELELDDSSRLVWVENLPQREQETLIFRGNTYQELLQAGREEGPFIMELLRQADGSRPESRGITVKEAEQLAGQFGIDGSAWLEGPVFRELMDYGLLVL